MTVSGDELTDKQVASLQKKFEKAKPWKRAELVLGAFAAEPVQAKYGRAFRFLARGGLSDQGKSELAHSIYMSAINAAQTSRGMAVAVGAAAEPASAIQVVEYLASVPESIWSDNTVLGHVGTTFIARLVFSDSALFEQHLPKLPPSFGNLVTMCLRLVGREVALQSGFVSWFGQQYAQSFPEFDTPQGDGWDGAKDRETHDSVPFFDHEANDLTASGRRLIELFTTVDEWSAARGPNAYLPDVGGSGSSSS
ncbi:MAG: hypothetical protein GXP55_21310 [Deltaproteobacteria bacterium]|nr:hypothetical protein [Deltaproteobacteria bacterium]